MGPPTVRIVLILLPSSMWRHLSAGLGAWVFCRVCFAVCTNIMMIATVDFERVANHLWIDAHWARSLFINACRVNLFSFCRLHSQHFLKLRDVCGIVSLYSWHLVVVVVIHFWATVSLRLGVWCRIIRLQILWLQFIRETKQLPLTHSSLVRFFSLRLTRRALMFLASCAKHRLALFD